MAVPAIALYASSPSSSYPSYDFDVNGSRSCSHGSSSSSSQKATTGGLSYLFNSTPIKTGVFSSSLLTAGGGEELGTSWKSEKGEELSLSSSYGYSHFNSLFKRDHHSPISVFQCPVSCTSSASSGGGSIRGSPLRSLKERSNGDTSKRLFSGFVRNALGSCLDAEVDMGASPSIVLDELTFNMEDGFVETASGSYAKDLLLGAQMRHKIFCDEFVVKAFNEAEKAHRGQMRASGDPYLQHCVETAVLLALVGANSTVVAAGLLHDTIDDSFIDYDYILRTFGSGVADLVDGVSKLSQLSKLARENNTASRTAEADRLHTMFLAMADARAVLIKLADRLHNMMTLDSLPLFKQQRFAKETLEIFAPLANRLGIYSWKEQLENLCFKHLNVEQYEDLSSKLLKSFDEAMVSSSIEKLEQALRKGGVSYHALFGRHKSLYSIYRKMLKKKLNMNEIHDIHGLRLILENEDDCYKALQVVHQIWPEVPGRFKDYISHPKVNGYQSLHTVVMGEGGLPVEVQIRTKEMHLQAEIGFAAHWRYKEGDCKYASSLLQRIEWARWVLSWQCEAMSMDKSCFNYTDSIKPSCAFPSHSEDCPFSDRPVCSQDGPVFVIVMENDKMSVQEFLSNSTVMDLLERAGRGSSKWTPYRFPLKEELRPRLNREPVNDPTCKLKMGDVVELTPSISDKSLTKYREEIQRLFNQGLDISTTGPAPSMVGWGS